MEILTFTISLFLFIALLVSPIIIYRKLGTRNYKFLLFAVCGIFLTSLILLALGWWSSKSTEILLSNYGYNFEAMNNQERYLNVASENIEKVKTLEISRNGIGWPAKLMFISPFYFLYLLVVYVTMNFIQKRK